MKPPKKACNSENITLHFKLDKVSLSGLLKEEDGFMVWDSSFIPKRLDPLTSSFLFNFTSPCTTKSVELSRTVARSNNLSNENTDLMPGFNLSWYYTGLENNDIHETQDLNDRSILRKYFIRYACTDDELREA